MSKMYQLLVLFRQNGTTIKFHYNDLDRATAAYIDASPANAPTNIEIVDDFGTSASFNTGDVMIDLIEDTEKTLEAGGNIQMLTARANVRLQNRAKTDPVLNGTIVVPNGPAAGRPARQ